MLTRTREEEADSNDLRPEPEDPSEYRPHPLASVIGSFRDDLASLDAIMAGVEEYRQRMGEESP